MLCYGTKRILVKQRTGTAVIWSTHLHRPAREINFPQMTPVPQHGIAMKGCSDTSRRSLPKQGRDSYDRRIVG